MPEGQIVFFFNLPKIVEGVLETWVHHNWMLVKYGILIYVSHLWSSTPAELQGGDDCDGGYVPDLVHLVAQLGSELDPKCDA